MKQWLIVLAGAAPLMLMAPAMTTLQAQSSTAQTEFFETKIRPIFQENCVSCHGSAAMGGLRLDSREMLLKGGRSGPVVVPGDPDKSVLIAAVKQTGPIKMPKRGERLTDAQIADLTAWVTDGAVWPVTAGPNSEAALAEFFENHIRPVLAQQCFACHTNSKSGGLRLDSRQDMLKGGNSGPAVVPGDPSKSLLIAAVRHSGPLKMPKGGTRLSDEELGYFTTWVTDGAFWPIEKTTAKTYSDQQKKLWSIQPLQSRPTPDVKDTGWPINDIDRFVLAKLEKEGLRPTVTADRRTLLRRVTYDLTGLMPAFEEVRAFESDHSPNAWEKVIDRLLASPQYGERWARHWMDVVRYGEDDYNVGKRPDRAEKYSFAYIYRDWLIRALNEDMPYDLFVKAQLAADLLPERLRDKNLSALGMNGNGIWIFHASPAAVERADEWHDKVDVTSKAFLGLTIGCARCHDHKYDAIYTKDYYSMASIFASSRFKAYPQVPKAVADEYDRQKKVLDKKTEALNKFVEDASGLYAQMLFAQTEDYMMAAWKVSTQKRATVESVAEETKLDPEILSRWVRFLKKKPDNYSALVAWQEMIARNGKEDEAKKLAHEFFLKAADVNDRYQRIAKENEVTLAQVKGAAAFDKNDESSNEPFDPLPNGKKRRLNNYQIDLKSLAREDALLRRDMFERDVPEATGEEDDIIDENKRKPGLLKLTDGGLERRLSAELKAHVDRARADIDAFKKAMPPQYPFIYGIEEASEPSDLKVFVRGNPYSFGEDAPRAFPSIFFNGQQKAFADGSGRLAFAEEVVRQPIAARVIVNRMWRWHTGRGIVESPSNFGMIGELPSNPELLDYLASKFIADGMSWKKLTREILMSRTYQLSTVSVPTNAGKDPDNKFFWRANRRRLEAEGVWDLLLQASGSLDTKSMGGPSEDLSDKTVRRGVYARVSRMYPNDFQATFDVPPATISAEKRYVTNVPQQRLFFLNNSFVLKQAERLAEKIRSAGTDEEQVKKAFVAVYQREPMPEEIRASLELLHWPVPPEAQSNVDGDDKQEKKRPDNPLRSFCWALLSSNEFLYIE